MATATSLALEPRNTVLIVEDDFDVARANQRALERLGWIVKLAPDVASALTALADGGLTVVLCDINLPDQNGVTLLDFIRRRDLDIPVVLLTGHPSVQTAVDALELGASEYLVKPVSPDDLNARLLRAVRRHLPQGPQSRRSLTAVDPLAATFARALDDLFLVFQPIFDLETRELYAFEALMRSRCPEMQNPLALLEAAEKLGRLRDLGRKVRALAHDALPFAPDGVALFVNLHASDLSDPELYQATSPLTRRGQRVVLEVTERASMTDIADPTQCVRNLRALGYRIAIDDLGAGYAGLSGFAVLEPDVVKLDMSLVRDIHLEPTRQRIVESMVTLCKNLGVRVVAEGIETMAELNVVRSLGCDLGQGYGLGRPVPSFSVPPYPTSVR